ncbi:MAG: HEAT repeat domain-containing protein [Elusimicrobiota bacterium]
MNLIKILKYKNFSLNRIIGFLLFICILSSCQYFVPIYKRVLSNDSKVRTKALIKLQQCSEVKKKELIPQFINLLNNPDTLLANRASEALVSIGPLVIPELLQCLNTNDVLLKIGSIQTLGRLGSQAEQALGSLLIHLTDSHPLVRQEIIYAIDQIGVNTPEVRASLKKLTQDPDDEVKRLSLETLDHLENRSPEDDRS